MKPAFLLWLLGAVGCAASHEQEPFLEPVGPGEVRFDDRGVSAPVVVEVPAGARSITVLAVGDDEAVYGLASLVTADGIEHVALDGDPVRVFDDYPTVLPEALFQFPRFGTFSHTYPLVREHALPAGPVEIRIGTTRPDAPANVQVVVAQEDGSNVLHVAWIHVRDGAAPRSPPPYAAMVDEILGQAGIRVVTDAVVSLPSTAEATWEGVATPSSPEAELVRLGTGVSPSNAVRIFLVEPFPGDGFTLGLPGPPDSDSYYYGVVMSREIPWPGDPNATMGRLVAHELAHFLGLHHPTNTLPTGEEIGDPFSDTPERGFRNLMDSVDRDAPIEAADWQLTGHQRFALTRSPLLQRE